MLGFFRVSRSGAAGQGLSVSPSGALAQGIPHERAGLR